MAEKLNRCALPTSRRLHYVRWRLSLTCARNRCALDDRTFFNGAIAGRWTSSPAPLAGLPPVAARKPTSPIGGTGGRPRRRFPLFVRAMRALLPRPPPRMAPLLLWSRFLVPGGGLGIRLVPSGASFGVLHNDQAKVSPLCTQQVA